MSRIRIIGTGTRSPQAARCIRKSKIETEKQKKSDGMFVVCQIFA